MVSAVNEQLLDERLAALEEARAAEFAAHI